MTHKTHQASNAAMVTTLAAVGAIRLFSVSGLLFAGGSVIGSMFPDIDHPRSTISKYLGSKRRKKASSPTPSYQHRHCLPHWPFFALIVLLPCFLISGQSGYDASTDYRNNLCVGFAVGALTHLFVDMFNYYGILLLAPFSTVRFRLAAIKTKSRGERKFCIASVVIAAIALGFSAIMQSIA